MGSPEEIREVLAAGPRPGVIFLPTLFLEEVKGLADERDLASRDLQQARESALALHIMALANGYSAWGEWRYLVIGGRETGQVTGIPAGALHNDRIQQLVRRYCTPVPSCYYREGRAEGRRVGLVVIRDSALKPFRFAVNVQYEEEGRPRLAYRQGDIWMQGDGSPRLANEQEEIQLKLDAALVQPSAVEPGVLTSLSTGEQRLDFGVTEQLASASLLPYALPAQEGVLAPAQLGNLLEVAQKQRLLVLCGPHGIGKKTLAHQLAQQLQEEGRTLYRPPEEMSPADFLSAVCRVEDGAILVGDIAPDTLQRDLAELQAAARRHNHVILLTSVAPSASWSLPPAARESLVDMQPGDPYTSDELTQLLVSRLQSGLGALQAQGAFLDKELLSTQERLAGRTLQWIATRLGTPGAVVRFAELAQQRYLTDERELLRAIHSAADLASDVIAWYGSLVDDERYFVLAVCLFGELPLHRFWQLYEQTVADAWRQRQPNLRTVPGLNGELARYLRDDLTFRDPACRPVILAEALQRYQRPLVWALPQISQLLIALDDSDSSAARATRATLAQVTGEVARSEWETTLPLLRGWATARAAMTRSAAAQALWAATEAGQGAQTRAVVALLGSWSRNEALEAGWAAPRHAHRVRETAALALGRIAWNADPRLFEAQLLPPLWHLARDPHPRVREAVAGALQMAGPAKFPEMAGLLGQLANDASQRVRSHVALTLAQMAIVEGTMVSEILLSWNHEAGARSAQDAPQKWTALLALLLWSTSQPQSAESLAAWAEDDALLQGLRALLIQLGAAPASRLEPLLPLLEGLAARDEPPTQELAVDGLLALARSPRKRPAVQATIDAWRSASPPLREVAATWSAEWLRMREVEPRLLEAEEAPPAEEELEELETSVDEDVAGPSPRIQRRGSAQLEEKRLGEIGPQRWLRRATPLSRGTTMSREVFWQTLGRVLTAVGLMILASLVLDRFPYYNAEWLPVLLLAILALGYWRPAIGAGLLAALCVLPLLYYAPTLLLLLVLFGAALFLLSGSLGQALGLQETLLIFGMPVLMLTPLQMAVPFLVGWLFRRRGAYLVFWGLLLAIVVGLTMGQSLVGSYLSTGVALPQNRILVQAAPAEWQSLGWLRNLEIYKGGISGAWETIKQLLSAFLASPFPLVQLALWALATWLVGWALEQSDWATALTLIACVALGLIATYIFIMPDILGWSLPFQRDTGLNAQILVGAAFVLAVVYGWPYASSELRKANVGPIVSQYLRAGEKQLRTAVRARISRA